MGRNGVISAWVCASLFLPSVAKGNLCSFVYQEIKHRIGFARRPDVSMDLASRQKFAELNRIVPELSELSNDTAIALVQHIGQVSPQRVREALDRLPSTPFWKRRMRGELFHLRTTLRLRGLRDPQKVERLAVLEIGLKQRLAPNATSAERLKSLEKRVTHEDPEVAMLAVLQVGGVTVSMGKDTPAPLTELTSLNPHLARDLLALALDHPSPEVRGAARRGLVSLDFFSPTLPGGGSRRYGSDSVRAEVTAPLRELRQRDLAGQRVSLWDPATQKRVSHEVLAAMELERLPIEDLQLFLDSPRDVLVSARALTVNRTVEELVPFLSHANADVRRAAALGLTDRFVEDPAGVPLLSRLVSLAHGDSQAAVRTAAIGAMATHPRARASLEHLAGKLSAVSPEGLAVAKALQDHRQNFAGGESLSARLRRNDPRLITEEVDLDRVSVGELEAAIDSGPPNLKLAAVRALANRKDGESIYLLGRIVGTHGYRGSPFRERPNKFPVELRIAALEAASGRNHPLIDRLFETAATGDPNVDVYHTAIRLVDAVSESSVGHFQNYFRTASRRLKMDAELIRKYSTQEGLSPEEKRMDDHATLLSAAANTYSLPMVGSARAALARQPGADPNDPNRVATLMVQQRKTFLEGIPLGYRVVADVADSTTSGLKLYYLEPTSLFPGRPRILAIAGTEKWLDWYGNTTWGALKRETPAYQRFLDLVMQDVLAGKKVQITGHSLGGGIAQYMGYDVAKRLESVNRTPAPPGVVRKSTEGMLENLEVVTWNSFGVEQAIRRDPADYDKDLLAVLAPRMTHYRTPFDLVSKLGEATGTRMDLPSTGWWGVGAAHATGNLVEAAVTLAGLEAPQPQAPWFRGKPITNTLVRLLEPVGRYLTEAHMKSHSKDDMAALLAAREAWVKEFLVDSTRVDPWLATEINELVAAESQSRPDVGARMLGERQAMDQRLNQIQFQRLRGDAQ